MRLYVASSWRNRYYDNVLKTLQKHHSCYDFKNPPGSKGFSWTEFDAEYTHGDKYSATVMQSALAHSRAVEHFYNDYYAMTGADACVLVLPCGRSAHLEAGWFIGANKGVYILMRDNEEPELMYKMATRICATVDELVAVLGA